MGASEESKKEPPTEKVTAATFHHVMGHISVEGTERMLKERMVDGIELKEGPKDGFCASCTYTKTTHKPISKE
jgi:hypothetical protein